MNSPGRAVGSATTGRNRQTRVVYRVCGRWSTRKGEDTTAAAREPQILSKTVDQIGKIAPMRFRRDQKSMSACDCGSRTGYPNLHAGPPPRFASESERPLRGEASETEPGLNPALKRISSSFTEIWQGAGYILEGVTFRRFAAWICVLGGSGLFFGLHYGRNVKNWCGCCFASDKERLQGLDHVLNQGFACTQLFKSRRDLCQLGEGGIVCVLIGMGRHAFGRLQPKCSTARFD
jgi:hypothetical protein